ncbi:MAG: tetratricopeptide repeat protein, partial [Halioglobus sp.]
TLEKDDPRVVAMMTAAYTQAGLYDSAIQLLQRLGDSQVPGSDTHLKLALTRLKAGQTTVGLTALEAVYAGDNTREDVGFPLAMTYLEMGRADDAAAIAVKLVEISPESPSFHYLLGMARADAGDTEGARTAFADAVDRSPDFVNAKIGLARLDRESGQLDAARKTLDAVLAETPGNTSAMMEMARLELSRQNPREALNWAEEAVRADAGAVDPRLLLIEVLVQTDQLEAAEKSAWDATAVFANNMDCMAALARVQMLAGKKGDSLNTYRRMQKVAASSADQLHRVALLQMQLGAWEDARYTLYNALTVQPEHLPSLLAYLRVHLALGQAEKAVEISDTIIAIDPKSAEAWGLGAHGLLAMQQYPQAEERYQQALAIAYDPRWVVGRYQTLLARNQKKEAVAVLREELGRRPGDTALRGALIGHLLGEQLWQEAKPELEIALEQEPGQPSHLNNLAYALNE